MHLMYEDTLQELNYLYNKLQYEPPTWSKRSRYHPNLLQSFVSARPFTSRKASSSPLLLQSGQYVRNRSQPGEYDGTRKGIVIHDTSERKETVQPDKQS